MPARWPSTWWTTPACQRASPARAGHNSRLAWLPWRWRPKDVRQRKQNAAHRSALRSPGPGAWQLSADTKLCRAQYTHNWPICAPSCLALGTHATSTDSAIWNIFKIAGTRGADVSPCRRGAIRPRSACGKANRSGKTAHSCPPTGPPPGSAGGLATEQRDQRQGQGGQKGTAVSHYRRVRVPGGHAHPRPGDHLRVTGCPAWSPDSAAQPATAAQRRASGARSGCAALAATRALGHKPHDDEYGHRDQPDDNKRLERSHDPARSRDGKPYGEDPAKDCPDDPAHVPSMPPDLCRRRVRSDHRPAFPGPRWAASSFAVRSPPSPRGNALPMKPAKPGRRPRRNSRPTRVGVGWPGIGAVSRWMPIAVSMSGGTSMPGVAAGRTACLIGGQLAFP